MPFIRCSIERFRLSFFLLFDQEKKLKNAFNELRIIIMQSFKIRKL